MQVEYIDSSYVCPTNRNKLDLGKSFGQPSDEVKGVEFEIDNLK